MGYGEIGRSISAQPGRRSFEALQITNFVLQPWHLLVTILVGEVNEEQQRVIEQLRMENQVDCRASSADNFHHTP